MAQEVKTKHRNSSSYFFSLMFPFAFLILDVAPFRYFGRVGSVWISGKAPNPCCINEACQRLLKEKQMILDSFEDI